MFQRCNQLSFEKKLTNPYNYFDELIKKSRKDLISNEIDYNSFVSNQLPIIKEKKSAIILYKDHSAIGYEIILIKNKEASVSFSYIIPEERGKGYSAHLRSFFIKKIQNEVDKLSCMIKKSNSASIKSFNKLLRQYNCFYEVKTVRSAKGEIYEKYVVSKRLH